MTLASGRCAAHHSAMIRADGSVDPSSTIQTDRKSTRLNSSHANISYAVFCLKKKHRCNASIPSPRPTREIMLTYSQTLQTTASIVRLGVPVSTQSRQRETFY